MRCPKRIEYSTLPSCLNHELLTAKLNACDFSLPVLRLINDYLSKRKQRTKIENAYSTWLDVIFGVPQGLILGPLLFNVFLADLILPAMWMTTLHT